MAIQLTEEQYRLLAAQPDRPLRVFDRDTNRAFFLLAADGATKFELPKSPQGDQSQIAASIPEEIHCSKEAFLKDLPALLKRNDRRGQWVVYHGHKRLGFAATETELYQKCRRRGLAETSFFVGWIGRQVRQPETVDPSLFEFTESA